MCVYTFYSFHGTHVEVTVRVLWSCLSPSSFTWVLGMKSRSSGLLACLSHQPTEYITFDCGFSHLAATWHMQHLLKFKWLFMYPLIPAMVALLKDGIFHNCFFHLYISHAWTFCLHICLCTMCMPIARGGHKMVSDALELELQNVVIHYVGVKNWTRVLWKSSKHWASFLAIYLFSYFSLCEWIFYLYVCM